MFKFKNRKTEINANTDVFCIFGNPVKHSLSPVIQNAAFKKLCINAVYIAFEIDDIKTAIQAMKVLNIRGASVTIPFKNEVLKYIDIIDPLAIEIGSVNTLRNYNKKIYGYNTDGYGAVRTLVKNNIRIKDSKILVLGNGGSARAIAVTLLNEGAGVTIAGRNIEKVSMLVDDIKKKGKHVDYTLIKDITIDYIRKINLIINTTSAGMSPDVNNTPIAEDLVQKEQTVFDIVYSPETTKLLEISKGKGCRIIHGIEMLINQGAMQFEIWTGEKAPVSAMEKAVRKYHERNNQKIRHSL